MARIDGRFLTQNMNAQFFNRVGERGFVGFTERRKIDPLVFDGQVIEGKAQARQKSESDQGGNPFVKGRGIEIKGNAEDRRDDIRIPFKCT